MARTLVGAYNVVARQIATAEDQQAAVAEYGAVLRTLLRGLAAGGPLSSDAPPPARSAGG